VKKKKTLGLISTPDCFLTSHGTNNSKL